MTRAANKYRVAISGDFLRFRPGNLRIENSQLRNVAWLSALLEHVLGALENVCVTQVMPSGELAKFKDELENSDVWSEYESNPEASWARFYSNELPNDVFPKLLKNLAAQDFVIGFELPPSAKRFLDSAGVRYVSLYVHPMRYLRDLCFGLTTNCPHVALLVERKRLEQKEILQQVSRFKAFFAGVHAPQTRFPAGVPLLAGQTSFDSSLLSNGKFVDWKGYQSDLINSLNKQDLIVFLEHPFQSSNSSSIELLRSTLDKDVISVRGNNYAVLFSFPGFSKVLSLSSSLGVEAESIGYDTKFLFSDPRLKFIDESVDQENFGMLGHVVFDSAFWRNLFFKESSPIDGRQDGFFLGDNYVRNSLGAWSYRNLQYGLIMEPMLKRVMPNVKAEVNRSLELGRALIDGDSGATESELTDSAAQYGIEIQFHERPLNSSSVWRLPIGRQASKYYLEQGFHETEQAHVWTSDPVSCLTVPVAVSGKNIHAQISMDVSPFLGVLSESPVLAVRVDGKLCGYALFRPDTFSPLRISFDVLIQSPIVKIRFDFSCVDSPKKRGFGEDARQLGFALHGLEIIVKNEKKPQELPKKEVLVWEADHEPFAVEPSTMEDSK